MPEASPSKPSIKLIAFAIPTIHRQESPKPNHCGKLIDPRPKNWTELNERFAPQTTNPAIKNSPSNFVLGDKRARSSKKPIIKTPSDPRRTDPITAITPNNSCNRGTANPAIRTTSKKDRRTAAPPNRGVA